MFEESKANAEIEEIQNLEKQLAEMKAKEVQNEKVIKQLEEQKAAQERDFDVDNIP